MLVSPISSCLHCWIFQHALLPACLPAHRSLDLLLDHWRSASCSQAVSRTSSLDDSPIGINSTTFVGVSTRSSSACLNSQIPSTNCQKSQKSAKAMFSLSKGSGKISASQALPHCFQISQDSGLSLCSPIHQFPGGKGPHLVQILQTIAWLNQKIQIPLKILQTIQKQKTEISTSQ